jgi:cytochrome P450
MVSVSGVRAWFDKRDGLPPGPPFPPILQTAAYAFRPIELMELCGKRYGDAFTLRFQGFVPEVFFSHPDAIKEIFTGDPEVFAAGKANAPFLGPLLGESSLLLLDGARHLRERKLMLPPFHGERMQSYAQSMREIARAEIARWKPGELISARERMLRVTFDVILRTVFGLEQGPQVATLSEMLAQIIETGSNPIWLMPTFQIDLGVLTPWGRLIRQKMELDRLLLEEISRRRKQGVEGKSDILSMLIAARYEDGTGLGDLELRDEMITLLAAGHETTATALAWTLLHIVRHPSVLARCKEEARSSSGGSRFEYLDAAIKESLRLSPVIPAVGRILERPARVGGFDLPAGVEAVPVVYLTHRRPDVWPEPEKFKPERFLDARPSPYEFLPFGGGVRRCIGMQFALFEMGIVLSEIFSSVDLRLRPGYVGKTEHRSITFIPKDGVELIVDRRS